MKIKYRKLYKGKTYHGCTKDGTPDRRCWCYTGRGEGYTGSFDPKDNQWGFCPCATTTLYGYWRPWLPWQSCVCGQAQLRGRYCRFPIESVSNFVMIFIIFFYIFKDCLASKIMFTKLKLKYIIYSFR